MAKIKIALDAGHYGEYNASPLNNPPTNLTPPYYEAVQMWKLRNYLGEALEAIGLDVVLIRSEQKNDLSLAARADAAKGCDLLLSLHSNAPPTSAANYNSIDYPVAYCQVSGRTDKIGASLVLNVQNLIHTTGKGFVSKVWNSAKNADYYGILRQAAYNGTPALILEHSFHTNLNAVKWLLSDANLRVMARSHAETLANYFGVSVSVPAAPEPQEVIPPAAGFTPYMVQVTVSDLNIRKTPGASGKPPSDVTGVIRDKGSYTIVEEQTVGTTPWGRLKSGAGWISLSSSYVAKQGTSASVAPAPTPVPAPSPTRPQLKKGSTDKTTGGAVSVLQNGLKKYGRVITVDGDFGAKTDQHVREFQRANGLTVDGLVGPKTWSKMESMGLA